MTRLFAVFGAVIFFLIAIAAAIDALSWFILRVSHRSGSPANFRQSSPVYAGMPWASEFWQEESRRQSVKQAYVPFRLWSVSDWSGKYIHNDPSEFGVFRRTINPQTRDCPAGHATVWVFGGSAVYGTGVPDWATLPSYLSRDMNAGGARCVWVSNFGVEGYVTNQELLLLLETLKKGVRPDTVIFYDGVNDAAAAGPFLEPSQAHFIIDMVQRRIEGTIQGRLDFLLGSSALRLWSAVAARFQREDDASQLSQEARAKAVKALDNYEANIRVVSALSRAYGFTLYTFWQPSLYYSHKELLPFEKTLPGVPGGQSAPDSWSKIVTEVCQEAERRGAAGSGYIYLGHIFDSEKDRPLYIDQVHLGPLGSELAAQAIADYLKSHPSVESRN